MEIIKKYVKAVNIMNEWIGRVDAFIIIPLVLITVYEVVMRKFFNSPTIWVFETSNQLYAMLFMLGLGFALLRGSHVNIDIFYRFLSPKGKAIADAIAFVVFFFPFCLSVLWFGTLFAAQSWEIFEVSQSVLRIPLFPIKTIIPVMALTLLLQGTAIFIKRLYLIFEGKELQV